MIRGEIWWADFGVPFGSEPGFRRPVVIVQSDDFNKSNMNTVIVIPLTTNIIFKEFPGNIFLVQEETKLSKDSVVVTVQIVVIDKRRLIEKVSTLSSFNMKKIENGIKLVLEL